MAHDQSNVNHVRFIHLCIYTTNRGCKCGQCIWTCFVGETYEIVLWARHCFAGLTNYCFYQACTNNSYKTVGWILTWYFSPNILGSQHWFSLWHKRKTNHNLNRYRQTSMRHMASLEHLNCCNCKNLLHLGSGLLSQFSPFRYFPNLLELPKHWLPVREIWTRLKISKSKFPVKEKLTNGALVIPTPEPRLEYLTARHT